MADKYLEVLLVEDNEAYRNTAINALQDKNLSIATNYDEALQKLELADYVITDIFFQQNKSGNNSTLQARVLNAIKYGLVKNYVQQMSARVKEEAGIESDKRLRKCFETIGYHQLACGEDHDYSESMINTVSGYVTAFKKEAAEKLERAVNEIIGVASEKIVKDLFNPLEEYMKQAPENQPLGYLVAEEAEKLQKSFVLVTSLRHAEKSLKPILESARMRGWNILERKDGSKESSEFWLKAYNLLKGGEENGKKNN